TAHLHVTPNGNLAGFVRNDTSTAFANSAVIVGHEFAQLPALNPGQQVTVSVHLQANNSASGSVWTRLYGHYPDPYQYGYGFQGGPPGGSHNVYNNDGICCFALSAPRERTLRARIRDAVTQLPEAQRIDRLGQVLFAGWSEQSL